MRLWSDIITDLNEPLDINRVKTRPQGKIQLPYLEGDDVINTANQIFGEDGWDAFPLGKVERFEVGTKKTDSGQILIFVYTVPYMVRFHGFLEDGSVHTIEKGDIGKNSTQSEAYQQHEMAISGCATDALKRAMRHLGRQFGITLYDKTSEDFKAVMNKGKKGTTSTKTEKKSTAKAKKTQPATAKKDGEKKKTGIQRALEYVIPEELTVEGKSVRLPSAGKTVDEVLSDPMGDNLLVWLAGLRESPAKTPPFVAATSDEISLQNAITYVLLNKRASILEEEEVTTLQNRLKQE